MSAIVCGKRSFFEDLPTPTPVSKRIRSSSSSRVRYSPPRTSLNSQRLAAVEHLLAAFPGMDKELIERLFDECDDDLGSAIGSLNELHLGSSYVSIASKLNEDLLSNSQHETPAGVDTESNGERGPPSEGQSAQNLLMDGAQWVELFVSEMMSTSNMDDARVRASRALKALEKSIVACASAEATQSFQQENAILKEQVQALVQENLKRAVAIQHERQKDYEDKTRELQHLKQLISQYQEQLHTLEVNNYALVMHLKQAQQNSSISGRFNPDTCKETCFPNPCNHNIMDAPVSLTCCCRLSPANFTWEKFLCKRCSAAEGNYWLTWSMSTTATQWKKNRES